MPIIRAGEVDLHVEEMGRGPPVLFAAGLGGRGGYWRAQMEDLARDHRVVTFDHRGVGRSGPAAPPFSVSGLAGDVVALMDALGLARAAFVGHSTGGAMGQYLAARHPERFSTFVLGATWRDPDPRFIALFQGRKDCLLERGGQTYVRDSLLWTYPRDWFEDSAATIEARLPAMAAELPPVPVLAGRLDAIIASDHAAHPIAPGPPVMIVHASDDCLVPPSYGSDVARAIPRAVRRRLATGGHHFPQTRARDYNRLLRAFLMTAEWH